MSSGRDDSWKTEMNRYLGQVVDDLETYRETVEEIVSGFSIPRKGKVRSMLAGPMGEQFMTSPASSRRGFHNAFHCGLVDHSLNVVRNPLKIAQTLAPGRWSQEKLTFTALFHDLGKAGTPGKPYYIPVEDEWRLKKGEYFERNKEDFMPNSEKSLFVLQVFGIEVDHEEFVAIRLNDGMGPDSNKEYNFKEPDLALIVHWADHWSSRVEKQQNQ